MTVFGQKARATWKAYMQQHVTDMNQTTPAPMTHTIDGDITITHCHNLENMSDHPSTDHTSTTLSSGSSTPEAMYERRARTGPGKQATTVPIPSDEDDQAPPDGTSRTNDRKQQPLHRYFCTGQQSGFDEDHRLRIESEVQAFMKEAEANHLPHQPLCSPINETELS